MERVIGWAMIDSFFNSKVIIAWSPMYTKITITGEKKQINKALYYTELSWIKKICERNFCDPEVIKHNLLKDDITIILKK